MKRFTMFACLALALAFALNSFASEAELPVPVQSNGNEVLYSTGPAFAKASRDTTVLVGPSGSGALVLGTFQDNGGNPNWNGWTHYDVTQPTEIHWQASTFYAVTGTYSAWCGAEFTACPGQPDGFGYGNTWNDMLEWRGTVANNTLGCSVTVTANVRHDSEGGYDFTWLSHEKFDQGILDVASWDGAGLVAVNETFTYAPGDYMGAGSNEVVVMWRFSSDGAWSDEDCLYPTTSGACQVDDVVITLTNGTGYSHDFEDGTLGAFEIRFPQGTGDFAKLWTGLEDLDPCNTNYSSQAAFIDDGIVVPGTGGSPCISWCYGPSGFIINVTGGLAGLGGDAGAYLFNAIESPVFAWTDPTHDGADLLFDTYRHLPLATGAFYTWAVRGATSEAGVASAGWADRNFVYYSNSPDYLRTFFPVGDLLAAGRTHAQIQLAVYELGWAWGYVSTDATPAPYFDNVRFITYPVIGPQFSARDIDLAQDNFPTIGQVDYLNLGDNDVRFDMARNISLQAHQLNDPGDSIIFDAKVVRAGAVMVGLPRMYYKVKANPVFDAYRSGFPLEGYVVCDSAKNNVGAWVINKYFADLPDEDFLYPGDILHYYFWAQDDVLGDVQTNTLPADTTGFSNFDPYQLPGVVGTYPDAFRVRALPSVKADLTHPAVLFWNDFATRGGQQEWHGALANLGLVMGVDYDTYLTQGPSSGVGNGLGGRATQFHLDGYSDMLYSAGDLGSYTLANGDFQGDPSKDAELLALWMGQTDKDIFLTGDGLASNLQASGSITQNFLENFMGVSVTSNNLRPLIGTQTAPRVLVEGGNPVFTSVSSWIAYGGCALINQFDAVTTVGGAQRIAQFANASGAPGGYAYSAATLYDLVGGNSVISMPYDLLYVYTDADEGAKADAALSARARLLQDVLVYFGISPNPGTRTDVPAAGQFAVKAYPNPFNPKTTIAYTVPRTGQATLKIFNVRGELVKTLVNGLVEQGSAQIEWDGSDNAGGKVSSGVYFYEFRQGENVASSKMTLLK
ncbi:MAG: T9SS type A sorting domain-containing protein [Krumholzibacteria bacterium]|nr:T9SS type A sorting domain-containing protein [Candidatus Krumholzibacteria bacterium]